MKQVYLALSTMLFIMYPATIFYGQAPVPQTILAGHLSPFLTPNFILLPTSIKVLKIIIYEEQAGTKIGIRRTSSETN